MKPYYTNEVLFTATAEELQMLRVGMSRWLKEWEGFSEETPEDREYYKRMQQLYKDVTKCLEQLPF